MGKIISRLLGMTSGQAAEDDLIPIQDVSVPKTKVITLALLRSAIMKASSVVTSMIADGAVTTRKFKPTVIKSNFTPTGSRFSSSSDSYVPITNCSMTYTSGAVAEKLILTVNVMAIAGTGNAEIALFVNGVMNDISMYIDPGSPWVRASQAHVVDVPANTTVTLALYAYSAGGTMQVTTETAKWLPTIRGFAVAA